MTMQEKQTRALQIIERLKERYPNALCALEWEGQPWKLLVMGSLSAQCTDARVNLVCRELFSLYPTPEAVAQAPIESLERIIRPCGLYRVKAKNTQAACKMLTEQFGGVVPDTMDVLLTIPGVGRKVANLLLGDLYHKGGTVADTHCIRICGRLGFYPETERAPLAVERKMNAVLPQEEICDFCHRMVQFGRDVCTARAPRCTECPLSTLCAHAQNSEG